VNTRLAHLKPGILACSALLILSACQAAQDPGAHSSAGATLFKDDFSSTASGWPRFTSAEGVMDYDGGGYRMLVKALNVDFRSAPGRDFGDVRLEADAGKLGGPDQNRFGLVCRYRGADYYFFVIGSDGFYGIGIFTAGRATLLGQSQMQSSDRIRTGAAVNHLRADCNGDQLTFYVNGFQLARTRDSGLQHGDVGLLAGSFSQPGVDVIFDNFLALKP
jgi:hypothetical protein